MVSNATISSVPARTWPFLVMKVLVLQFLFYSIRKWGSQLDGFLISFLTVFVLLVNYFLIKNLIFLRHYIVMMILFYVSGFIQDSIFISLNKLVVGTNWPPLWISCLWLLFLCHYGDVFRKMLFFPIWLSALLGSAGGTLAYYRGLNGHHFTFSSDFYYWVAAVWAFYMPFSLGLFRYFMWIRLKGKQS